MQKLREEKVVGVEQKEAGELRAELKKLLVKNKQLVAQNQQWRKQEQAMLSFAFLNFLVALVLCRLVNESIKLLTTTPASAFSVFSAFFNLPDSC